MYSPAHISVSPSQFRNNSLICGTRTKLLFPEVAEIYSHPITGILNLKLCKFLIDTTLYNNPMRTKLPTAYDWCILATKPRPTKVELYHVSRSVTKAPDQTYCCAV